MKKGGKIQSMHFNPLGTEPRQKSAQIFLFFFYLLFKAFPHFAKLKQFVLFQTGKKHCNKTINQIQQMDRQKGEERKQKTRSAEKDEKQEKE